jgi:hypothetical protein
MRVILSIVIMITFNHQVSARDCVLSGPELKTLIKNGEFQKNGKTYDARNRGRVERTIGAKAPIHYGVNAVHLGTRQNNSCSYIFGGTTTGRSANRIERLIVVEN